MFEIIVLLSYNHFRWYGCQNWQFCYFIDWTCAVYLISRTVFSKSPPRILLQS